MDALTLSGLFAVSAMLICYWLEERNPWFILLLSLACVMASVYGFLQGAWPFGMVNGVWSIVAFHCPALNPSKPGLRLVIAAQLC
jgi:hypothetical protein